MPDSKHRRPRGDRDYQTSPIERTRTTKAEVEARRKALPRQHTAMPMIGFLNGGSSWEYAQMAATFRKGFGETGLLIVVLALVKPLSPPGDLSGQLICGPIEA